MWNGIFMSDAGIWVILALIALVAACVALAAVGVTIGAAVVTVVSTNLLILCVASFAAMTYGGSQQTRWCEYEAFYAKAQYDDTLREAIAAIRDAEETSAKALRSIQVSLPESSRPRS